MALARVFDVPPPPPGAKTAPAPIERKDRVDIPGRGDAAKQAARAFFSHGGYDVRSINWGPDQGGKPELVVYLAKKDG